MFSFAALAGLAGRVFGSIRLYLYLGAALAAVGVGGYILWLRADNARLAASNAVLASNLETATRTAEHNARELELARAAFQQDLRASKEFYEKRLSRARKVEHKLGEIENAPKSDDGPIAPVLRRTLDELRDAPGGDGNDPRSSFDKAANP